MQYCFNLELELETVCYLWRSVESALDVGVESLMLVTTGPEIYHFYSTPPSFPQQDVFLVDNIINDSNMHSKS